MSESSQAPPSALYSPQGGTITTTGPPAGTTFRVVLPTNFTKR